MINYDTILSAFDDKETLLKWLQKVEKALTDSTLTSVDCVNVDDSHIKFSFNFADGSTIDTPDVYVKPGVDGTDGKDGVGFNTLSEVDIPASVASVLYSAAAGATVTGQASFKTAEKTYNVVSKMIMPIAGAGAVNIAANARKIEVSLDGYAGASAGQYPRKTASGLEWVAGTGGGATVETGTFSAPVYQANIGASSTSWEQIPNSAVNGTYSYIGDLLTINLGGGSGAFVTIAKSKTFYVSLRPLIDIFNIPAQTARNIIVGAKPSSAGVVTDAYPFTYCEGMGTNATMFAIQFQKSAGYGTSTNAYITSAQYNFLCPAICFTINGVSKI